MSKLSTSLILLPLFFFSAASGEGAMTGIFPYEHRSEVLDNGLKVIVIPMSSGGLVAYWSIVRTGSRDEYEPGRSGFAHFFEHMMFRGTENYPADAYNRIVTEMGADANAYTTDDLTAYHLGIAAEDLATVMAIESDRFEHLAYSEEVFRTEAGAVYGEYRKSRMNPFFRVFEGLQEAAFTRHTYGHTTMGYERDIRQMPEMYDYSRSFFDRYYRPDNVVLLIVGDVNPESTIAMAREHYGDWKRGYQPSAVPAEPVQAEERRVEVSYDGRTLPVVALGYKVGAFDSSSVPRMAVDILVELAFGATSEIHKKLVLDEQVAEFISGSVSPNRDPGLIEIVTRVKDPAKIGEVIGEIERTAELFRSQAPNPERLEDVKSNLKYGFLMGLDTPDRVASALARIVAVTGGIEAVDEAYATLDRVAPEDVRQAAESFLVPERRTLAVLRGGE